MTARLNRMTGIGVVANPAQREPGLSGLEFPDFLARLEVPGSPA